MNRTSRVKQRTLRIANLKLHEIRRHPGFNNRRGREDGVGMGGLAEVSYLRGKIDLKGMLRLKFVFIQQNFGCRRVRVRKNVS